VGAGPTGLTAAYQLVREGYNVTVIEAMPVAGGMMAIGIPEYRLSKHVLQAEIDRIIGLLEAAHLSPPTLAELQRQSGRTDVGAVLRLAAASGRVEAVERNRYYARDALDQFTRVLVELGREGDIVPAAVRDRLGISRKYLIPLLEWADGRGITVRVGDVRHLKNA